MHTTIVLVSVPQAWTAALACSGGDAEERARVQTNLALALSALLRFEEALSAAESAVELDPTWEKVCDGRLAGEGSRAFKACSACFGGPRASPACVGTWHDQVVLSHDVVCVLTGARLAREGSERAQAADVRCLRGPH